MGTASTVAWRVARMPINSRGGNRGRLQQAINDEIAACRSRSALRTRRPELRLVTNNVQSEAGNG